MIKLLGQLNIALSALFIWTKPTYTSGIFTGIMLLIIIWYNWKTILLYKGQSEAKRINFIFGIANIIIGSLIFLNSMLMIYEEFIQELNKGIILMNTLSLIFSISIITFSIITIKYHQKTQKSKKLIE